MVPRCRVFAIVAGAGLLIVFLGALAWKNQLRKFHAMTVFQPDTGGAVLSEPDLSGRKVVRVLCINGGGVRGVVPARVLAYLEERTGKPIAELFDVFVGTSVGGIIMTGCLLPGEDGKPLRTAQEVLERLEGTSRSVFTPSSHRALLSLGGVLAPKYCSKQKHEVFEKEFGAMVFGKLIKPAVLTAYDLKSQQPLAICSWDPEFANYQSSDLLTAATTVPGMFNMVELAAPKHPRRILMDVGILENNPAFQALEIARNLAGDADILIVDVGTGLFAGDFSERVVNHWGELRWLPEYIPLLARGNLSVMQEIIRAEEHYLGSSRLRYVPIDVSMPWGQYFSPFGVSDQEFRALRELGERCVSESRTTLDELAATLAGASGNPGGGFSPAAVAGAAPGHSPAQLLPK